MSEEIKSCPFCGSGAAVSTKYGQYRVHCMRRFTGCHVNMRTHDCNTKEEAVHDWNNRVPVENSSDRSASNVLRDKVSNAAHKALRNPNNSKAAKTAAGSALSQPRKKGK